MRGLYLLLAMASAMTMQEHPLTRVINMLKDMQTELADEGSQDSDRHVKAVCALQKTIQTENEEKVSHTSAMNLAKRNRDGAEAKYKGAHQASIDARNNMDEANGNYMETSESAKNDRAALNQSVKDLSETYAALKNALTTLGGNSFLQATQLADVQKNLKIALLKMNPTAHGMHEVLSFAQAGTGDTGAIVGTLTAMKESTKSDLDAAKAKLQKTEADNAKIMAGFKQEAKEAKEAAEKKQQEASAAQKDQGEQAQAAEGAARLLKDDIATIAAAEEDLATENNDFAARQKARSVESAGIADTIAILSSDNARKNSADAIGFVQLVTAYSNRAPQQLSLLAAKVGNEALKKISKKIKDNIATLRAEQKEDQEMRNDCKRRQNANSRDTTQHTTDKEEAAAAEEAASRKAAVLEDRIADNTKTISEQNRGMHSATYDRAVANKQNTKSFQAQKVTQNVLNQALNRMKQVYESDANAAEGRGAVEGAKTATREQNSGGNKVIALLTKILGEVSGNAKELQNSEADMAAAYKSFMRASNEAVSDASAANDQANIAKAGAETDKANAAAEKNRANQELGEDMATEQSLHKECYDYVTDSVYEKTQKSRANEINNLESASTVIDSMQAQKAA